MRKRTRKRSRSPAGFTLVELLVVVIVLAIIGAMVAPMMVGATSVEAVSAARMIAADLQYAQNVAITTQSPVKVTFYPALEKYDLVSNASGLLKHPMTKADYVVDFRSRTDLGHADIVSANFASSSLVTFDELGSPDNGGAVTVQAGAQLYRVDVAPVTGVVSVTAIGS